MSEYYEGLRVVIPTGYGYFEDSPIAFRRAEQDLHGIVRAVQGNMIYVKLADGRKVHSTRAAIRAEGS